MSLNRPPASHNDVNSYLVGAIPFLTSSVVVPGLASPPGFITFPNVTRKVYVRNMGNHACTIGFSLAGASSGSTNFWKLDKNGDKHDSFEFSVRVGRVYFHSLNAAATQIQIFAELTPAPSDQFLSSFNNWSGSIGI
jgi:hypothetical protein